MDKYDLSIPIPVPGAFMGPFLNPTAELDTLPVVSGGGTNDLPFDAAIIATSGTTADVTFRPGTINSLLASNYLDTFSLTGTTTTVYFAKVNVTTLNGLITTYTLEVDSTPPTAIDVNMGQPPTSFVYLLGVISNALWFRTAPNGSLSAVPQRSFSISKTSPAPGTLPYDTYWTWLIALG